MDIGSGVEACSVGQGGSVSNPISLERWLVLAAGPIETNAVI